MEALGLNFQSWGRYPRVLQRAYPVWWRCDRPFRSLSEEATLLPHGLGRSYGDSCLNENGAILPTRALNHFIKFDREAGVVTCEAGLSFRELLEVIVPAGWFLPVVPGTQYVTVGGAIANDVHGKNHHVAGTFGSHILGFELQTSDGKIRWCSRDSHAPLFFATIGGLGLTGLITSAKFSLKPIVSSFIDAEEVQFRGLDEFAALSSESAGKFSYTVAWLDCVSSGENFCRGIFIRGNHAEVNRPRPKRLRLIAPFDAPEFLLNNYTVKLFNALYYHKQRAPKVRKVVHYEPFFFPLDSVRDWNRIYGKRGFFQFQCVIPPQIGSVVLRELLEVIVKSGQGSFLAVLKEFGDAPPAGMMSFPRPGITLALDFANRGEKTLQLLRTLDQLVREGKGAIYPAKDAIMAPESFQQYFPVWKDFQSFIDPRFSSSFWRRVTEGT